MSMETSDMVSFEPFVFYLKRMFFVHNMGHVKNGVFYYFFQHSIRQRLLNSTLHNIISKNVRQSKFISNQPLLLFKKREKHGSYIRYGATD